MLKRIGLVLISALILTLLFPASALAFPQQPHQFYGTVNVGDGVLVEAKINGTTYGTSLTHGGEYGLNYDSVLNLMQVAADDPDTPDIIEGGVDGDTIQFYVGTIKAEQEYTFAIGGYTELPLSITGPATPTLETIGVTPESASVLVGQTRQFTATGTYSEGDPANITTEAVWTSSDTAVATVEAGLASGVAEGDTTITATLDGKVGEATLTVVAPSTEPDISVNPMSKNFGSVTVGSSSSAQTFTVSNAGTDLVVGTITITGANANQFKIQNDNCSGATIAPGDSATLKVAFSPTSAGAKSATLKIPSNDPDEATVEVSLSGTGVTAPPPAGGGGWAPPTYYTGTNLFGTEESYRISTTGEILETIEATSADGNLTMTIPAGTIALDKDGNRLPTLTVAVDPSPPPPPEGANIIGLAYNFGPLGATFAPPITLEYTYDPADIPEGVAEGDLVLAFYVEGIPPEPGLWVELPCTVDPVTHRIIATVSHFTTFAIIAGAPPPAPATFALSDLTVQPAEVLTGEAVTVAVSVANTGGTEGSYTVVLKINGVKEAELSVTMAAGDSATFTFSVTKEEAASYSVVVDGLSASFTVVSPLVVEPAAFSVSNLSIQPAEVPTGEEVTIEVAVTNTGGTEGSYTVILKINGVKEAEQIVTIAAGGSPIVIFSLTKEAAGSYSVTVDGLSGSFTVVAPATNWPLIGGIIGAVIVIGLLVFFLVFRRRA